MIRDIVHRLIGVPTQGDFKRYGHTCNPFGTATEPHEYSNHYQSCEACYQNQLREEKRWKRFFRDLKIADDRLKKDLEEE